MAMVDLQRVTVLPPELTAQMKDNPENLTREGIQYKGFLWAQSANRYMKSLYAQMQDRCQRIKPSKLITEDAVDTDGKQIKLKKMVLSYDDDDKPKWIITEALFEEARLQAEKSKKRRR